MTTDIKFDERFYRNWIKDLDRNRLYQEVANLELVVNNSMFSESARAMSNKKLQILKSEWKEINDRFSKANGKK
jgi:hypothetical protein